MPGKDKSPAAFQQDLSICRQHAISHSGYSGSSPPASGGAAAAANPAVPGANGNGASVPAAAEPTDDIGYAQCMAARGDIVQMVPGPDYDVEYAYADGLGYGYGYGYPYTYPWYDYSPVGYGGGFAVFAFHGQHHQGFHGGGFHHGGFHGGAFHGGGMSRGSGGGGGHGGGGAHH